MIGDRREGPFKFSPAQLQAHSAYQDDTFLKPFLSGRRSCYNAKARHNRTRGLVTALLGKLPSCRLGVLDTEKGVTLSPGDAY